MNGDAYDNGQGGGGPERPHDPLANYVLKPEERAAPPKDRAAYMTPRERMEAELAETKALLAMGDYAARGQQPFAPQIQAPQPPPRLPEPGVWPPPVYDQPQVAPQPFFVMPTYQSASGIARVIVVFASFNILVNAIMFGAAVMGSGALGLGLLDLIRGSAEFGIIVMLLAWINRAYKNLKAFHAGGLSTTPVMAVLCWFLPFVSFYKPYMVVSEIWRASDPAIRVNPLRPLDWQQSFSTPLIMFWWFSYFLPVFLIVGQTRSTAGDVTGFHIGIALTSIMSSVLTMLVVNGITARQDQKISSV